jgi:hemolysin-activating ACP:hemolysin acyltransferase
MLALGCKQFTIRMNKDGKVTQFCCWWRCHDSQVEVILKRFRLDDSRTPKNVCLGDSVIVVDSAQTAGSFIESRRRTLDKIGPYKRLAWYRRKDERDYYRIYGGHYGWR